MLSVMATDILAKVFSQPLMRIKISESSGSTLLLFIIGVWSLA